MSWATPLQRLTLGIVMLTLSILLGASLLGITTDTSDVELEGRKYLIETLAIQASINIHNGDLDSFKNLLQQTIQRNDKIVSVALRGDGGQLLIALGEHESHWTMTDDETSSPNQVRVTLYRRDLPWGTVEMVFMPLASRSYIGFIDNNMLMMILLFFGAGSLSYYLLLRKVLNHLDPTAIVPTRVRTTVDSLTEGLVLMDEKCQIVMSNIAFAKLVNQPVHEIIGQRLSSFNWHYLGNQTAHELFPWDRAFIEHTGQTDVELGFHKTDRDRRILSVNAIPIFDDDKALRGIQVTFDDITELEQKNAQLTATLTDLEQSRATIEQKNKELLELATKDPLTNCFNRRAFFEIFNKEFAAAQKRWGKLSCFMADIDHFKRVNDNYGHGIGDQAIQYMAEALRSVVRDNDYVCRYGGEEFCVLLTDTDIEQAWAIAERVRQVIMSGDGVNIELPSDLHLTSSFGVSTLSQEVTDPAALVDQADQALYHSKENGRNQVTRWDTLPSDSASTASDEDQPADTARNIA